MLVLGRTEASCTRACVFVEGPFRGPFSRDRAECLAGDRSRPCKGPCFKARPRTAGEAVEAATETQEKKGERSWIRPCEAPCRDPRFQGSLVQFCLYEFLGSSGNFHLSERFEGSIRGSFTGDRAGLVRRPL